VRGLARAGSCLRYLPKKFFSDKRSRLFAHRVNDEFSELTSELKSSKDRRACACACVCVRAWVRVVRRVSAVGSVRGGCVCVCVCTRIATHTLKLGPTALQIVQCPHPT
jgi:hypothetical protein